MFDNGCHSAPWRQVQGDIAYLQIKPCDGDTIYVTASTFGYYVIKVSFVQEGTDINSLSRLF